MKIPVLMYHRIGHDRCDRRFTVSPMQFEQQMQLIAARGYRVKSLAEIVAAIEGNGNLEEKVLGITFDDGFKDTYNNARPVLKRLAFPATFFLVSGLLGKTNMWMQNYSYAATTLMDWRDVRQLLADGFTVGSHSCGHPDLQALDEENIVKEVDGSKRELENKLRITIHFFAYPYGSFDSRVRNIVKSCGYRAACSTRSGFNNSETDVYALRRLDISGTDSMDTFHRSIVFGENSMTTGRTLRYYAKRAYTALSKAS